MEIQLLHKSFTEKNPKELVEHIQNMAFGDAPFFSTTLGLVYDKLVERVLTQSIASGSGPGNPTEAENQSVSEPAPVTQPSNPRVSVEPSPTLTVPPLPTQQPSAPAPGLGAVWLECFQCGEAAMMRDLYDGLRCPQCPSRSSKKGRPFMKCPSCNLVRGVRRETCMRAACLSRFM